MVAGNLSALAVLIRTEREPLLADWRQRVCQLPSAARLDAPTLNDHIPMLLDELAAAFVTSSDETTLDALRDGSPPAHGAQRLQDGFNIAEVVSEYNILRGCLYDLAESHGLNLEHQAFHVLNFVLDKAIGLAVETYSTERALEVQRRREDYLAFVAHDLRTPLNAISLAARVLDDTHGDRPGPARSVMLRVLRRNIVQLEALVNKVLEENSHLQTEVGVKLERRDVHLWPVVEALIHDIHPVAGTSSTLLINTVPDELVAFADAGLLRRIFQNLIANAITYTPRGEVHVGAEELTGHGGVKCWVSDNGAGISRDLIGKVFDKGEGDPDKPGSTGLGLAIVKMFVESHGGAVDVESTEGAGTTIRFTLPARG